MKWPKWERYCENANPIPTTFIPIPTSTFPFPFPRKFPGTCAIPAIPRPMHTATCYEEASDFSGVLGVSNLLLACYKKVGDKLRTCRGETALAEFSLLS